jgi:multiple sugar transport system permease protein
MSETAYYERRSDRILRFLKHATIVGVLLFALFPFYMMLNISVKTNAQFYANPFGVQGPLHWENWGAAWAIVKEYLANTLLVAISSTFLGVSCALGGAYFFARLKMPGARIIWALLVLLLMMPTISNLIPLFVLLKHMSLLNTLWALILVGSAGMQALSIFVLRGFVEQIPADLFEAAEIDGASHFQQFWNIVVPLSGPIVGTFAVTGFLSAWNDFILPLIVLRDTELYTVTVGLMRLDGSYLKEWGKLMAGYSISSIPVILLFIFTMRLFIRGMTEGAVKG